MLGEVRDRRVLRFRCQTGHAYSAMTLLKVLATISEAAVGAFSEHSRRKLNLRVGSPYCLVKPQKLRPWPALRVA